MFHRQRRLHLHYGGEKEERNDSAIWCNKLVDIQRQYKIINNGQEKDSVVTSPRPSSTPDTPT